MSGLKCGLFGIFAGYTSGIALGNLVGGIPLWGSVVLLASGPILAVFAGFHAAEADSA